jgi:hypothetical protein
MSFIKKNYEKILLGAVLLGLVVSLLMLPIIISHDQQALQDMADQIIRRAPKPLPALDMSRESNVLNRIQSPFTMDFESTNRLFNPVPWQRASDGHLIKVANGNEVGPRALMITRLRPLYFIVKLDHFDPANQFSAARYDVTLEHQNGDSPIQRRAHPHYISVGEKDEAVELKSVSGPANTPQLTVHLLASGDTITVSQASPYQEVEGYAADLAYPPEGKKWSDQRVGAPLKFYRNDYNIVVISSNQVVISAESNQKKTTLQYQP